jgi:hypothetical protein
MVLSSTWYSLHTLATLLTIYLVYLDLLKLISRGFMRVCTIERKVRKLPCQALFKPLRNNKKLTVYRISRAF